MEKNNSGCGVNIASKNDDKNGFLGTIDTFTKLKLAAKIKKHSATDQLKLFGQKNKIVDNTYMKINVTYTIKDVNQSAYKYESTKSQNNIQTVQTETPDFDIFLPVVFNENIEKSIEECEQYNKLMWAKYSGRLTMNKDGYVVIKIKSFWGEREKRLDEKETKVYNQHKTDFENVNYTVENFKCQCAFYNDLIDEFIEKNHLRPPEKKRAASIFFYILMGLAIVFLGFCIFAPGLLILLATMLGISAVIATKIISASYVLAPVIALIFFKLARYISWKQNDYEEPFTIKDNQNQDVINEYPESYSKYNEELKLHKIWSSNLTGEKFETDTYKYNDEATQATKCPLYLYYHDAHGKLKKNTKTPIELLLKLKKAYEIPKQFKNTKSTQFAGTEDENKLFYDL